MKFNTTYFRAVCARSRRWSLPPPKAVLDFQPFHKLSARGGIRIDAARTVDDGQLVDGLARLQARPASECYNTEDHEQNNIVRAIEGATVEQNTRTRCRDRAGCVSNGVHRHQARRPNSVWPIEERDEAFSSGVFRWMDADDGEEYVEFHVNFVRGDITTRRHTSPSVLCVDGGVVRNSPRQCMTCPLPVSASPRLLQVHQESVSYRSRRRHPSSVWGTYGFRGLRRKSEEYGDMSFPF